MTCLQILDIFLPWFVRHAVDSPLVGNIQDGDQLYGQPSGLFQVRAPKDSGRI